MTKKCVVYGCSNTTRADISLHLIPKDRKLFKRWEKFVQRKRACWRASSTTVVCSNHFDKDVFHEGPLQAELGFGGCKRRLKSDAVPSVFQPSPQAAEPRSAFCKREVGRILDEVSIGTSEQCKEIKFTLRHTATNTEAIPTYTKGTSVSFKTRTMMVQTSFRGPSKGCQCVPLHHSKQTQCNLGLSEESYDSDDSDSDCSDDSDEEVSSTEEMYVPESECNSSDDDCDSDGEYELANQDAKFIVYLNMLLQLFKMCQLCGRKGAKAVTIVIGTMLIVHQSCLSCDGTFKWMSQPYVGSIPAGNLLLSAAILYSGSLPTKFLRALRFLGVQTFDRQTFFRHQRQYLIPAVLSVWQNQQVGLLGSVKRGVICGGDARCDSMGHSAKYGSYTLLDLVHNKILAMELVQSNETKGSYHMELEGLKRCFEIFKSAGVKLLTLVTDRHAQIQKWMRTNHIEVTHYFDIWHVAKGLKKKLAALEKKGFKRVGSWRRSIINHLYWSVVTSDGNGDMALAKWDSILNHIINCHTGHSQLFPNCVHPPVASEKDYFLAGTEEYEVLADVLTSSYLRRDIKKLSPLGQTFGVEGFHSLVNHFAPKMYHFGYMGMKCRLILAVLHYNNNSAREQATRNDGELQFTIAFPKAKQGGFTVKRVMTSSNYSYVDELMTAMTSLAKNGIQVTTNAVNVPPPLCSLYDRPNKDAAIQSLYTRFQVASHA